MTGNLPASVQFFDLSDRQDAELEPGLLAGAIDRLVTRLTLQPAAGQAWGLKVQLSGPGLPAAILPAWTAAAGKALARQASGLNLFSFDTLSITQEGLHTGEAMLASAGRQGYLEAGVPRFLVGDADPEASGPQAEAARGAAGLLLLSAVKPHPHLGFLGAVAAQGLGLATRRAKLDLHRDIRPRVDTPLCAGCGSCLAVCLFDAIRIQGGRATIDHTLCTGCGECMTVCHMAGIAPEDAARIPDFQHKLAAAAAAMAETADWGRPGRRGYINFLVHLNRQGSRAASRRANQLRHIGVLAGTDPVAVDRATWDLLAERAGGSLSGWGGYLQEPGPLLDRAAELGLGTPAYNLVEIR